MTEQELDQYIQTQKKIEAKAEEILEQYRTLANEHNKNKATTCNFVSYERVEEGQLYYTGYDFRADENHTLYLPLSYLYEDSWLWQNALVSQWNRDKRDAEIDKKKKQAEQEMAAQARKRADYERLKKEFGDDR